MNIKQTIIALVAGIGIIAMAILFNSRGGIGSSGVGGMRAGDSEDDTPSVANVSVVNGVQIIDFAAKGGFAPRKTLAKAAVPTTLRFTTDGTFDCSSSVRLPKLNISQALPQTGITDINIGAQTAGTLQGTCGMGMYPFEVAFQ